jgi:hypothetical protein
MAVIFLLIYVFYVFITWYTDRQPAQTDYKAVQKPSGFKPKDTELGKKVLDNVSSGESDFEDLEIPGVKSRIVESASEDTPSSHDGLHIEIPALADSQAHGEELTNNLAMSQVKAASTLKELLSPWKGRSNKEIG